MGPADLPVPVLNDAYWRVNIRPDIYQPELIPSLKACFELVQKTKVRLRGWDYPHLSREELERGQGTNWIASWCDFMGQREYWRLYQSGQFLHLFSVSETMSREWREKLAQDLRHHLRGDVPKKIAGYISILNFLYTITEIFEFAARLSQRLPYQGEIEISIRLNGIKGFALVPEWDRSWDICCVAEENELGHAWTLRTDALVSGNADYSLKAVIWFFERFGWLDPSAEVLRSDQQRFLAGKS